MQQFLIIRQSPKRSVRLISRVEPRFSTVPDPRGSPPAFAPPRDRVMGKTLSPRGFPAFIPSFATNIPPAPPDSTPSVGKEKGRARGPRNPRSLRTTPAKVPAIRTGIFPPIVCVLVSVCCQPPGGSIPPILRADCLTERVAECFRAIPCFPPRRPVDRRFPSDFPQTHRERDPGGEEFRGFRPGHSGIPAHRRGGRPADGEIDGPAE